MPMLRRRHGTLVPAPPRAIHRIKREVAAAAEKRKPLRGVMPSSPPVFCAWKWGARYTSHHANVWKASIKRNYPHPCRFLLITDDPRGLDPEIETMPMPRNPVLDRLSSPHGANWPACYRRLWMFSGEALSALGPVTVVMVDLDSVTVGNVTEMVHRGEDFVIWGDPRFTFATYCGAAWMLRLGTRQQVWDSFDPARSPAQAKAAGCNGSDQGWISYCLWPDEAVWTREDGLLSARWIKSGLPVDAVMVQFAGRLKPWDEAAQRRWPWIKTHWRL